MLKTIDLVTEGAAFICRDFGDTFPACFRVFVPARIFLFILPENGISVGFVRRYPLEDKAIFLWREGSDLRNTYAVVARRVFPFEVREPAVSVVCPVLLKR